MWTHHDVGVKAHWPKFTFLRKLHCIHPVRAVVAAAVPVPS